MERSASARWRIVPALLVFLALAYGVAALGGIATSRSVNTWYQTLDKPSWTPEGGTIGAVWSILYFCMAVAAWLVWMRTGTRGGVVPLGLWMLQLALNLAWSVLFFGFRSPGLAFVDLAALWLAVLATTAAFFRWSRLAGVLFLPYLAWVAFAGVLNAAVWWMNS